MGAAASNAATVDALEEARLDPALEEARLRDWVERHEKLERIVAEEHLGIVTAFEKAREKLSALQAYMADRKKNSFDLYYIGYGPKHEIIVSNCVALCEWFAAEAPQYSDELTAYINKMFEAIASLPRDEHASPRTLLPFKDETVETYRRRIYRAVLEFKSGDQSMLSADEVRKVLTDLATWLADGVRQGLEFKRIK